MKEEAMAAEDTPPTSVEDDLIVAGEYSVPKFTSWSGKSVYDYEALISDYADFEALDNTTIKARKALFILTDRLNQAERRAVQARKAYERQYRREYLASTEKTQEARNMRAALKCEELENECLKYEQVKKELERLSFVLKSEVQTLNTVAHNLRAQLKNF